MTPIVINPSQIRQSVAPHALGLNLNFLADHTEMRARGQGYLSALRQMGVNFLRYPGGEKANEYFWSQPPWTESRPTLSYTGSASRLCAESRLVTAEGGFLVEPLDFDAFMTICRELGAEPLICVGLGSAYIKNSPGKTGSSREQVLENAIEWVRYANRVRGYNIKYWELGNESYWRGSIATLKAEEYTRDVLELAKAMKAIDPTIQIGVNGHVEKDYISTAEETDGPIWWKYLLENASSVVDFVVVHPYPCFEWGSYDYYSKNKPIFTDAVDQALTALQAWAAPHDADRIRVMATETNAFDWAATNWYRGNRGGWKWGNDLGHALVLFDLVGQHLAHPRVDGVHIWNTRWFESPTALENVLDDQNALLPTGQALALWGKYLHTHLLALPDSEIGPLYATYNPETQALTIFVMNKHITAQSVVLELQHNAPKWRATSFVFTGNGPEDEHPSLTAGQTWDESAPILQLSLPPVSISVITFELV